MIGCYISRVQVWPTVEGAEVPISGDFRGSPERAWKLVTQLVWTKWEEILTDHPDRWWARFLVEGIREGFRLGFSGKPESLRSNARNMKSADEHPQVVQEYLDREVAESRLWDVGSVEEAATMGVHCSPFSVIPKKGKPGKWRLILDLSAPEGFSVNDGIPKDLCSLGYMSVDDLVAQVLQIGRGAEMMSSRLTGMYQFTLRTGTCWECSGFGRRHSTVRIEVSSSSVHCLGGCSTVGSRKARRIVDRPLH